MAKFKYTLFYDFHTSTILPDVGANFDVEKFTDDLVEAKVDYLTWHAIREVPTTIPKSAINIPL